MMGLVMKMIESYGVAGGIAEQAISSIRTVYSYVGERQTLKKIRPCTSGIFEIWSKIRTCERCSVGEHGNYIRRLGF